jgi:pre-mRNA-splicing factor 18
MDFLKSAIQDEISKKRKVMEAASKRDGGEKKSKYISRAELEKIREEEYKQKEKERKQKEEEVK